MSLLTIIVTKSYILKVALDLFPSSFFHNTKMLPLMIRGVPIQTQFINNTWKYIIYSKRNINLRNRLELN